MIKVSHIYREQNRAADYLAMKAIKYERGSRIIQEPPAKLNEIIEEDMHEISVSRRVRTISYF